MENGQWGQTFPLNKPRETNEKGKFPTRKFDPPKNWRVNIMPVGLINGKNQ
jgi:hypothetical protein